MNLWKICVFISPPVWGFQPFQRSTSSFVPFSRAAANSNCKSSRSQSPRLVAGNGVDVESLVTPTLVGVVSSFESLASWTLNSPYSSPSSWITAVDAVTTAQEYAVISTEPIHTAFTVATFLPQPFWVLITLFPKSNITKQIMGGLEIPLLCSLVHLFIVAYSIAQQGTGVTAPLSEFNDVFNPFGDPQKAFMGMVSHYPNFVAEEWSHVLTWDLFVGRWIWLDGLRRNIFTAPAVLFTNLIGPPGLLIYWIVCTLSGKGILDESSKKEIENL